MSASVALSTLSGRLTDTQDRETYAALMCYLNSLPPGDEFRRLAELMGLLSLVGQRLPEAAAELLTELRYQTKTTAEYRLQVDERLAGLPGEVAEGVDVEEIVKTLSEAFRQQLANTGLENVATLLRASARDINALSCQISDAVKPVTQEYTGMASTISAELLKLTSASRNLQDQNAQLLLEQPSNHRVWQSMLVMVMFLLGGLCGIVFEKNQTAAVLTNISTQMNRIQTPVVLPIAQPPQESKTRGRRGTKP